MCLGRAGTGNGSITPVILEGAGLWTGEADSGGATGLASSGAWGTGTGIGEIIGVPASQTSRGVVGRTGGTAREALGTIVS